MAPTFETTVNIFNLGAAIVTIAAFVVGGLKFVYMVQSHTAVMTLRVEAVERQLEKLSDVTTKMAEGTGRMNLIDDRMLAQGKRLDTLSEAVMTGLSSKRNLP